MKAKEKNDKKEISTTIDMHMYRIEFEGHREEDDATEGEKCYKFMNNGEKNARKRTTTRDSERSTETHKGHVYPTCGDQVRAQGQTSVVVIDEAVGSETVFAPEQGG